VGCGASDACTLVFDCVIHDGQGASYLRYLNHKMRRETAVPIDEELQAQIQNPANLRWPRNGPRRIRICFRH
jgi:hypothetical protein